MKSNLNVVIGLYHVRKYKYRQNIYFVWICKIPRRKTCPWLGI